MIGVFDSGAGGIATARELRAAMPTADILFFRDRLGAPYGTKSKDELTRLVTHDIKTLVDRGADKILMACCTASTVYRELDKALRAISVPIIAPTAAAAVSATKNGKIGVIATKTTVCSHAFRSELHKLDPTLTVYEWQAQPLVTLVEEGARDGEITERELKMITDSIREAKRSDIDTLILGCTHFPLIEKTLTTLLGGVKTVSSAREGARAIGREYGHGRCIYLENKRR